MSKRWNQRPLGSNWGDFGDEDQIGRLNFIGEEEVLKGIQEVKEGKTFCLSLPLDYPGGQVINKVRQAPQLKPVLRNGANYFNYRWKQKDPKNTDLGSDDMVTLYTQYSTQWDSLAHRGSLFDVKGDGQAEAVYYNGYRAETDVVLKDDTQSEAKALGIENMAFHGVQGRGVLVDLHTSCGGFPRVEVGYDQLMRIMEKENVEVEKGDIVCFWTGLDQMIMGMKGSPDPSLKSACAVLDGWDDKLLQWITDSGVAAIASDNLAVEAVGKSIPEGSSGSNLPLHEHCLFKLGIHLGELWFLADLATYLKRNHRTRFLLTAPPLRLPGAVGSPVTPIATV